MKNRVKFSDSLMDRSWIKKDSRRFNTHCERHLCACAQRHEWTPKYRAVCTCTNGGAVRDIETQIVLFD